jgi:hypothetical protein
MYAWIITKDHLFDGDTTDRDEAGTTGPRDAPAGLLARLAAGEGREFRIYDDDEELYYAGRILTAGEPGSEDDFGPLDDWGTPNAGATEIRYLAGGKWETL